MSLSIPTTSVTWVNRRVPSFSLDWWTMSWTAEAICSRMERTVRSIPAIMDIVSSRDRASRGPLAWIVEIDPSWPVFMACSMSSAGTAGHQDVQTAPNAGVQHLRHRRGYRAERHQVLGLQGVGRELPDGQGAAVDRHRRDHRVHAGPVRQSGIDIWARLVDAT